MKTPGKRNECIYKARLAVYTHINEFSLLCLYVYISVRFLFLRYHSEKRATKAM
jgi:hypothetical protein